MALCQSLPTLTKTNDSNALQKEQATQQRFYFAGSGDCFGSVRYAGGDDFSGCTVVHAIEPGGGG